MFRQGQACILCDIMHTGTLLVLCDMHTGTLLVLCDMHTGTLLVLCDMHTGTLFSKVCACIRVSQLMIGPCSSTRLLCRIFHFMSL